MPELNYNPNKKNTLRNRLIGAGVIATLALAGTVIGVNASKSGEKPAEATSSSAPAHPSEAPTSKPEKLDVTVIPENVVEYNLFDTLTPDQQAEIKKMEDMNLTEFRALPYDEQYKFVKFVYDNNLAVLKYRLDQNGDSSAYKDANLTTPDGIVADGDLETSLIFSLKTLDPKKGVGYDSLTAKKMVALINPEADATFYANSDKLIDEITTSTPVATFNDVIKKSIVNKDGDIVMNVLNEKTGVLAQAVTRIEEHTDIQGNQVKGEFTILSVSESDPRFNPNLGE